MDQGLQVSGTASDAAVFDQMIAAFEQAWQEGSRPSIEQFISTLNGDDAETLLLRLIGVEVMYRVASGAEVDVDTYVARFPEHAEKIRNWVGSNLDVGAESFLGSTIGLPGRITSDLETAVVGFRVLGRYELREFIGRGAFGEVWRAYDPELRREVAIKTPRDDLGLSSNLRRQFVAEGRKAAKLRHPGIVRVYDAGETQGKCYIVSELIDGGTLNQRMDSNALSEQDAIAIVREVADALHYAHAQGVIHRDIKPGNILIDAEGRAHISDFGLAKMEGTGEASMASHGAVVGTPAYMSPEQASGRSREADGRTDIYSLGIVLFELLTYRATPVQGPRRKLLDLARQHEADPFQLANVELKDDLKDICRKAISLRPEDRYATAAEFASELSTLLIGDVGTSLALPSPKRQRAMVAALVIAVLVAMSMSIVAIYSHLTKGVPVRITTEPAGASLTFIPLSPSTGIPLVQEAKPVGRSPVKRRLDPGKYLVVAVLAADRFHEVYRTVPPPTEEVRGGGFWHMWWDRDADGTIRLPVVTIPPADIAQGMQRFDGSNNFLLGENTGSGVPPHWVRVPAFYADPVKVNRKICDERLADLEFPERISMRSIDGGKAFKEGEAPLTYVSWNEAVQYAERAGTRLIDEVEYAYAATQSMSDSSQESMRGDWLNGPGEWTSSWATSGPMGRSGQVVFSSPSHRVVRGLVQVPDEGAGIVEPETIGNMRTIVDQIEMRPDIGFRFVRSAKPRLTAADFVLLSDVSEKR